MNTALTKDRYSDEELAVLRALDHIGGGGTPIDIALEGMLEIRKTREVAEHLWGKGILLSHRVQDPDAKRFFTFSHHGEDAYRELLGSEGRTGR
jgi:hypothetical protein